MTYFDHDTKDWLQVCLVGEVAVLSLPIVLCLTSENKEREKFHVKLLAYIDSFINHSIGICLFRFREILILKLNVPKFYSNGKKKGKKKRQTQNQE